MCCSPLIFFLPSKRKTKSCPFIENLCVKYGLDQTKGKESSVPLCPKINKNRRRVMEGACPASPSHVFCVVSRQCVQRFISFTDYLLNFKTV